MNSHKGECTGLLKSGIDWDHFVCYSGSDHGSASTSGVSTKTDSTADLSDKSKRSSIIRDKSGKTKFGFQVDLIGTSADAYISVKSRSYDVL